MIRNTAALYLTMISLLLTLVSCRERPTSVEVEGGSSFRLNGSGRLASFTIYAPRNGETIAFPDSDVARIVWTIKSSKGYFEGGRVEGLQLTYGKVPDGYAQIVPSSPQVASPLSPGVVYSFFAETSGAPVASGYFYMAKSGPVQTCVPDLCVMLIQGRKVRVNCKPNSTEPYQEPSNLEEMVRKNRTDKSCRSPR